MNVSLSRKSIVPSVTGLPRLVTVAVKMTAAPGDDDPRLLGISVHNKLRAEGFAGGYSTVTRELRSGRRIPLTVPNLRCR
jgi:hypothetical protein